MDKSAVVHSGPVSMLIDILFPYKESLLALNAVTFRRPRSFCRSPVPTAHLDGQRSVIHPPSGPVPGQPSRTF